MVNIFSLERILKHLAWSSSSSSVLYISHFEFTSSPTSFRSKLLHQHDVRCFVWLVMLGSARADNGNTPGGLLNLVSPVHLDPSFCSPTCAFSNLHQAMWGSKHSQQAFLILFRKHLDQGRPVSFDQVRLILDKQPWTALEMAALDFGPASEFPALPSWHAPHVARPGACRMGGWSPAVAPEEDWSQNRLLRSGRGPTGATNPWPAVSWDRLIHPFLFQVWEALRSVPLPSPAGWSYQIHHPTLSAPGRKQGWGCDGMQASKLTIAEDKIRRSHSSLSLAEKHAKRRIITSQSHK